MLRVASACRCVVFVCLATVATAARGAEVPLADAAKNADWDTVRDLLAQGADVNATRMDGTTALHWAAHWDDVETADRLLRAGARVNAATDLGVTPLWAACENGSTQMVQRLLRHGADPNAALLSGETPLMTAARSGNAEVVKLLLAKGADVNVKKVLGGSTAIGESPRGQTALMWAVAQRHSDVVDVLLAHGADVHARSNVWTRVVKTTAEVNNPHYIIEMEEGGYTPLLFAARVGDLASAKLLVAAGADVNDTAPYGTSATVVAAHGGHGEVAAFLLESGADPNAAGAGYTALHAAILHGDENAVRALLAHGADPNARVSSSTPHRRDSIDVFLQPAFVGATPFWLAARYGRSNIMRLLAADGADPMFVHHLAFWVDADRQDLSGPTTSLMAAAGMGDRLYNVAGEARLVLLTEHAENEAIRFEAVQAAAELGVDVNAADANGNTALHAVAAQGYETVARVLAETGARLDVRNREGQTPLDAAMAVATRIRRSEDDTDAGRRAGELADALERTIRLLRELEAKK